MKHIIVILFVCLIPVKFFGQVFNSNKNVVWYKFQTDRNISPFCSSSPFNRIYVNDSVFIDNYFNENLEYSYDSDTFKVINQRWFYKFKGEYLPYLSENVFKEKKEIRIYKLLGTKKEQGQFFLSFIPYSKEVWEGKSIFLFKYNSNGGKVSSSIFEDIIYFDPSIGIIKKVTIDCGTEKLVKIPLNKIPDKYKNK